MSQVGEGVDDKVSQSNWYSERVTTVKETKSYLVTVPRDRERERLGGQEHYAKTWTQRE